MREFTRLLRLFAPSGLWLLLGLIFTLFTLAAQVITLHSAGSVLMLGGAGVTALILKLSGAARPVLRYAERLITHSATFRALAGLRLWLFARLVPLAPHAIGNVRAGDVLSRLLQDVDLLDGFILRLLLPLLVGTIALTSALALFWASQAFLLLQAALGTLAITAALLLFVLARQRKTVASLPLLQAGLRSHVLDGCEGLSDLLATDAADQQLHKITYASAQLARAQLAQVRLRLITQLLMAINGGILLMLAVVAVNNIKLAPMPGTTKIGLVLLVFGLLETLPLLGQALTQWPLLHAAAQRIFSLADTSAQMPEPAAPLPIPTNTTLHFDSVYVDYGRARPALENISLIIPVGARVLVTGASGAGKSTLLQLLLKFTKPSSGTITVGGTDLAGLAGDDWRRHIAVLSQATALLAGSVRENLLLAAPSATEAQLWQALEAAGLADFIRSLPDSLDSWVGEGGASFSGGQARRLALAQMILKDALLWLLDEPTEGLDASTAQSVLAAISRWAGARTVVLITHQPSLGDALTPTLRLSLKAGKLIT